VQPALIARSLERGADREHLESVNRAGHALRNFVERLNDRLTLVGDSYVKYYSEGRMALVLRCEISLPAKFYVKARLFCKDRPLEDKRVVFIVLKAKIGKPHHIEYWDEQLMLVEDVQFVQGPEGLIPSLVGLYMIQEQVNNQGDLVIRGETLLFQSAINSTYEFFPLITDWESCSMVRTSGSGRVEDLVVENVQCTFEIMESISDDEGAARHIEPGFVDVKSNTITPSVFLDANGVKVRLSERLEKVVKVTDVLHGPFNLTS
jgi:hypothetical protein